MKKRGSTDVDWVIAVALFIVFLLSIFVFLKPGITSPHRPEALLDIIENGIKQEFRPGIYWTVYELPLFIEYGSVGINCFRVPFTYDWSKDEFEIYKLTGSDPDIDPNNPPDLEREKPIPFKIDGQNIILKTALTNSKDILILVHSKNNDIFNKREESVDLDISIDCADNVIDYITIDELGNEVINFEYRYGVAKPIRGISEWVMNEIKSQADINIGTYTGLKESYGFPITKEFSGHLIGSADFQPIKPEIDANIFVREWSDFILNYNGLRTPVTVNIRVW